MANSDLTYVACLYRYVIFGIPLGIEAQALLDDGFLDILVDLSKMDEYWAHMLQEYPGHPAAANQARSVPIMLYGHLQNLGT